MTLRGATVRDMTGFSPILASEQEWIRNVLGSRVTRFHSAGAQLSVVHGRAGDVVPRHGYSLGSITYVVSGRIRVGEVDLVAGDAAVYEPPGYFAVRFIEDSTYVVARPAADQITGPDIGERSAANLDAG
jgi:quercetin dioxygenase-like cupin family protein